MEYEMVGGPLEEDMSKEAEESEGKEEEGEIDPVKVEIVVHFENHEGFQQIHFPFDLETDSPKAVAKEMVQELGLKKAQE